MNKRTPRIGHVVNYALSEHDADRINARRTQATESARADGRTVGSHPHGLQEHAGNHTSAGVVHPMVITRVWDPSGCVNGQVLLDGNDTHWVTSVNQNEDPGTPGHFFYPEED